MSPFLVKFLLVLLFLSHRPTLSLSKEIGHRCIHGTNILQQHMNANVRQCSQNYHPKDNHTTSFTHAVRAGKGTSPRVRRTRGPIRIVMDTSHLTDPTKVCTAVGQTRPDFLGSTYTCTARDILTLEKLWVIERIAIPQALRHVWRLLHVDPIAGPLIVPNGTCGADVTIPPSHTTVGVEEADVVLYALAANAGGGNAAGVAGTMAWASYCLLDQFGRPTVGRVNFVPSFVKTHVSGWAYDNYIRVVVHELFHALGFTPFMLRPMVNASVRRGKAVSIVTADAVVEAARSYLNCPTLDGVELEDEGGLGTEGTHWERRQWMDELMAGIPSRSAISPLSLAFFASLPFYTVRMEFSESMSWASGAGCDFVTGRCTADSPFMGITWCNEAATKQVCTYDRTEVGVCNIGTVTGLPAYFQYFTDPTIGGLSPLMDYCPVVDGYANRQCREATQRTDSDAIYGFYYGPQSRCVPTTNMVRNGNILRDTSPRCLRVRCVLGTRVEVLLGGSWISCPEDGSAGDVSIPLSTGYIGTIHCEPAAAVCSPALYDNSGGSPSQTPPREYTLDLVLLLNTTNEEDGVFLGVLAIADPGLFLVHLQADLERLSGYSFGTGVVRLLPLQALAANSAIGLAIYVQLGVVAAGGVTTVEQKRLAFQSLFAVRSAMTSVTDFLASNAFTIFSTTTTTTSRTTRTGLDTSAVAVTIASSEILPEVSVLDGVSSLDQFISLADVTLNCQGNLLGVSLPLTTESNQLLAASATSDLSRILLVTPNLISLRQVEILDTTTLRITATVFYPPVFDENGGSQAILLFWQELLNASITAGSSALPVTSSTVQQLAHGAPISATDSDTTRGLSVRSAEMGQSQPTTFHDPRCVVQFGGCFPVQIVVLILIIIVVLVLVVAFLKLCCSPVRKYPNRDLSCELIVPLQQMSVNGQPVK